MALALLFPWTAWGDAPFIPEQPTLAAEELKAGEKGYMLTVLKGTKPERIPIQVVGVALAEGRTQNDILIRLLPKGDGSRVDLALGMSGSPVYVRGKLVGAVGNGWDFSDHSMALVTPIAEMCAVFSGKGLEKSPAKGRPLALPLAVSGLSGGRAGSLARSLGLPLANVPLGPQGDLPLEPGRFEPGEALTVLLAWGDVTVAATGTVTATARDGRFLAMGHDLLNRGEVSYPAARASVHETVWSRDFPFKLASPRSLAGTIAQDRAAGLGGRTASFGPSISAVLAFEDLDRGRKEERRFRVVPDAFLAATLLENAYSGLVEEAWGRKGQGTLTITLRAEGRGIEKGWSRRDIFVSEEDAAAKALKPTLQLINAILTQPFVDAMPLGFHLDVKATQEPYALFIEGVEAPDEAKAGAELPVKVTLRPWRGRKTLTRQFTLKIPKDASGVCEVVVRGGGVDPLPQLAVEGGWKSIDSLERLLRELRAADANNELVVELHSDTLGQLLETVRNAGEKKQRPGGQGPLLLDEETEFLSDTKARRIKEGTLRIFRSDRFIDGMMKHVVAVTAPSSPKEE